MNTQFVGSKERFNRMWQQHVRSYPEEQEPEIQATDELYWTCNDQFNAICCVSICNLLIKQENIEMKWNIGIATLPSWCY